MKRIFIVRRTYYSVFKAAITGIVCGCLASCATSVHLASNSRILNVPKILNSQCPTELQLAQNIFTIENQLQSSAIWFESTPAACADNLAQIRIIYAGVPTSPELVESEARTLLDTVVKLNGNSEYDIQILVELHFIGPKDGNFSRPYEGRKMKRILGVLFYNSKTKETIWQDFWRTTVIEETDDIQKLHSDYKRLPPYDAAYNTDSAPIN